MGDEQAGAGLRSPPHASQWKAPLSPAASGRGGRRPLCFQETPPWRKLCFLLWEKRALQTSLQAPGPDSLLLWARPQSGMGGWLWVPGLGPHPRSSEEAPETKVRPPRSRNQGVTTPIQEHLCHVQPLTLPVSFSLLRPSPFPALTGTQFGGAVM